jgi:hypothetical protein
VDASIDQCNIITCQFICYAILYICHDIRENKDGQAAESSCPRENQRNIPMQTTEFYSLVKCKIQQAKPLGQASKFCGCMQNGLFEDFMGCEKVFLGIPWAKQAMQTREFLCGHFSTVRGNHQ